MTKEEILKFIKENEPHPLHDAAKANTLSDFMELQKNESFSDMLLRLIREKKLSEVEVYKAAGITPQHFSNIRSNSAYQPEKDTVLALAIAMKLNLPETKDLMRAAGLAFTHASRMDIVVEYYIINERWNLLEINEALYSIGLDPL